MARISLALGLALALALLPLEWALLLTLGSIVVTLTLLDPIWAVYVAVLSVPVQELILLPGGLSVTQAALLLLVASLALHTLAFPQRPLRFGPLFGPLLCFLLTVALAALLTPYSRSEALRELLRWTTVVLIYLVALRALSGAPWRAWGLVACLLLAPTASALVGLGQFWWGLGPESFGVEGGRVRAYGTIGQPNSFAGYMNQAWPLALGMGMALLASCYQQRCKPTGVVHAVIPTTLEHAALSRTRKPIGAPCSAICNLQPTIVNGMTPKTLLLFIGTSAATLLTTAALLVSFSRGGWLGGLGGLTILLLAAGYHLPTQMRLLARRGLIAGGGCVLLIALLGGGGLLPQALSQRAATLVGSLRLFDAHNAVITPANFAVVERMAHLQAAWNMLQRHPILGVGPGNYSIAYEALPPPGADPFSVRPWYDSRGHAHNYYLHISAEAGLLGLSAYLLLLGSIIVQAVRAVQMATGWFWQGVAIGGAGVVAAVATHNLFEHLHVLNMGLQLGSLLALLVYLQWSNEAGQGNEKQEVALIS
ncbi:O-antigen ligase family protein [Candidatus Viridilinea mediisalina]|uniref:O-antigen ligase family protein n=1 Tax=Candidatus Viridilinea mediisalina TaxID=2024553 RepID=UPI000F59CF35|nr:O-antigen ligase family protein [Candidatus Viridilinea mediisalina]